MLLKFNFVIKCHSHSNKVIRLLQYSSANRMGVTAGCIVLEMEAIIVLVLLAFNFIPQMSHRSRTLPRSRIRNSATVTLTPWGWQNSHQSNVISITDQIIF